MKLKILGSSSKGNSYIMENDTSALIIEAGVRLPDVKKTLDFNVGKIQGCLVSHSHNDHAGFVKDYIRNGIKVYTNKDVARRYSHNIVEMQPKILYNIGDFQVKALPVKHDVDCFMFLIKHPEAGLTAFITDTHYIPYSIPAINNLLIECNYSLDILEDNLKRGNITNDVRNRVLTNHLALRSCKSWLKMTDLRQISTIVLIHLSDGNSDARRFQREIIEETGKAVYVADKEMDIDLGVTPF